MKLSAEEYRTLVEQAPLLIWRANNTNGACDYFNERWLAFTGRTMEQEKGNGWTQGVHPEDFNTCLKGYLAAYEKRVPFELLYRLKRHDGQYRWIDDRGTPFFDDKKQFAGYIGSCVDITEKIKADEMLKAQREKELEQLRGLLPICSYCKKIRDDQGNWKMVEEYICTHSKADFSHGICPTCKAQFKKDNGL